MIDLKLKSLKISKTSFSRLPRSKQDCMSSFNSDMLKISLLITIQALSLPDASDIWNQVKQRSYLAGQLDAI